MAGPDRRLPKDSLECRQKTEELLADPAAHPAEATPWALLAIAAELAALRRELGKRR